MPEKFRRFINNATEPLQACQYGKRRQHPAAERQLARNAGSNTAAGDQWRRQVEGKLVVAVELGDEQCALEVVNRLNTSEGARRRHGEQP